MVSELKSFRVRHQPQVQRFLAHIDLTLANDLGVGGVEDHGLHREDAIVGLEVADHAADRDRQSPLIGDAEALGNVEAYELDEQVADPPTGHDHEHVPGGRAEDLGDGVAGGGELCPASQMAGAFLGERALAQQPLQVDAADPGVDVGAGRLDGAVQRS